MNRNSPDEQRDLGAKAGRDDPEHRHEDHGAGNEHELRAGRAGELPTMRGPLMRPASERRRADSAMTSSSETRKITAIDIAEP